MATNMFHQKFQRRQYFFIFILFGLFQFSAIADNSVTLDVSQFKVDYDNPTKAAVLAFIKRNWEIEQIMPDKVIGSYDEGTYKVEIDYASLPQVNFRSLKGSRSSKKKWLTAIEREFIFSLLSCE